MAPKTAHEAAKKKAAKQKKILIVLCVPMLGALFFAYQTLNKLHSASAPQVVAPAATPAGTSAPGTGTTPAAPTGTPISATTPIPATSDVGKLGNMSMLASKDPFFDAGPHDVKATAPTQDKTKKPVKIEIKPSSAVISVNGKVYGVAVRAVFPTSKDPALNGVFRLVGLTATRATISVVGGSYSDGSQKLTLTLNRAVTLVNTANGRTYTLVLYPPGTPTS
jgi:hypothetical protein